MVSTRIKDKSRSRKPGRADPELLPWRSTVFPALLCAILVLGALIPYDRIVSRPQGAFDTVEQMPTDDDVSTVDDVINFYRLNPNVRPYLAVRDDQIRFDPHQPGEKE